jgi:hypothetical protein
MREGKKPVNGTTARIQVKGDGSGGRNAERDR